jgi:tetratricopeptide (TPR) repeat protein
LSWRKSFIQKRGYFDLQDKLHHQKGKVPMHSSLIQITRFLLVACALTIVSLAPTTQIRAEVQNQSSASPALELVREGSVYYLRHDFEKAIGPYKRALDLEKEKRTLDKTIWKVLVDNLGMAYGITGDLDKAKETFAYGIEKDPDYPMFYYNMACTYGEKKDMDKAIEYLKLAFDRRENMIPGEDMPDPATDSSFKRFMQNEKFKAALEELK